MGKPNDSSFPTKSTWRPPGSSLSPARWILGRYQAGQHDEFAQLLRLAVDRIFSYLVFQEQHILRAMHTEASKARILGELSVNHLFTLLTEDETTFQQLQQQDQQYLSERLRQVADQLDATKPKTQSTLPSTSPTLIGLTAAPNRIHK